MKLFCLDIVGNGSTHPHALPFTEFTALGDQTDLNTSNDFLGSISQADSILDQQTGNLKAKGSVGKNKDMIDKQWQLQNFPLRKAQQR